MTNTFAIKTTKYFHIFINAENVFRKYIKISNKVVQLPWWFSGKNPPANKETQVQPLSWVDPLEEDIATTTVFFPGESHEQRSLVGCNSLESYNSPWGCKKVRCNLATKQQQQSCLSREEELSVLGTRKEGAFHCALLATRYSSTSFINCFSKKKTLKI